MTPFNRREFLASLLAVGATITIGVPLAQASPSQIDDAWEQLLDDPWYFDVNDSDTITQPGFKEPEAWGDVFDIWLDGIKTPDDVISQVEGCIPLNSHFQRLASDELDEVLSQLDDEDISPAKKRALRRLEAALQDPDEGWRDWITLRGAKGLPAFKEIIVAWLQEPIDGDDVEYLPRDFGGQGQALAFFEDLPRETLKALGVVIIEGDHPGSTYYAAELRGDMDKANAVASMMELPFRFRSEGGVS